MWTTIPPMSRKESDPTLVHGRSEALDPTRAARKVGR